MKKRIAAVLLAVLMAAALLPTAVPASAVDGLTVRKANGRPAFEGSYDESAGTVAPRNADYYRTETEAGSILHLRSDSLVVSGVSASEGIVIDEGVKSLTLFNAQILPEETASPAFEGIHNNADALKITLKGANVIGNAARLEAAVVSAGDIAFTGSGSLTLCGAERGLVSESSVTFDRGFSGKLTVESTGSSGEEDDAALYAAGNVTLLGGRYDLASQAGYGISVGGSAALQGLKSMNIRSSRDGIFAHGDVTVRNSKDLSVVSGGYGVFSYDGSAEIERCIGFRIEAGLAEKFVDYNEDSDGINVAHRVSVLYSDLDIHVGGEGIKSVDMGGARNVDNGDDVIIHGSTVKITAEKKDGIEAEDGVRITLSRADITGGNDGIYAGDGDIAVTDSLLNVSGTDDAMESGDADILIKNSRVTAIATILPSDGSDSEADPHALEAEQNITIDHSEVYAANQNFRSVAVRSFDDGEINLPGRIILKGDLCALGDAGFVPYADRSQLETPLFLSDEGDTFMVSAEKAAQTVYVCPASYLRWAAGFEKALNRICR